MWSLRAFRRLPACTRAPGFQQHRFISTGVFTEQKRRELKKFYDENGYLVVPKLIPQQDVTMLRSEIAAIARGKYGVVDGMDSKAPSADDDTLLSRYLAFHHPHKLSPSLKSFLLHPHLVDLVTALISPNVKCMQSMFFVKGPGKPGQAWHQDEYYIPTRDRSLMGVWVAVDDATIDNGCLWIHPGSHRAGILWPQRRHNDKRFDPAGEAHEHGYDMDGGVAAECPAGSVVVFHGYVLHRSLPNRSKRFRRAYVGHYMSAESLLPWDVDGTITEHVSDNRDIILVAGKDPYAAKGLRTDLTRPFIRFDVAANPDTSTGELRGAAAYKPIKKA